MSQVVDYLPEKNSYVRPVKLENKSFNCVIVASQQCGEFIDKTGRAGFKRFSK